MNNNLKYTDKELEKLVCKSYGSIEEWERSREKNKEILANMKINENGTESWVCKKCGHMIVADINGEIAKMKVGKNTKLFVKFTEMAAWCENCKEFNDIILSYIMDDPDSSAPFLKDVERYNKDIEKDEKIAKEQYILDKYLLHLR